MTELVSLLKIIHFYFLAYPWCWSRSLPCSQGGTGWAWHPRCWAAECPRSSWCSDQWSLWTSPSGECQPKGFLKDRAGIVNRFQYMVTMHLIRLVANSWSHTGVTYKVWGFGVTRHIKHSSDTTWGENSWFQPQSPNPMHLGWLRWAGSAAQNSVKYSNPKEITKLLKFSRLQTALYFRTCDASHTHVLYLHDQPNRMPVCTQNHSYQFHRGP